MNRNIPKYKIGFSALIQTFNSIFIKKIKHFFKGSELLACLPFSGGGFSRF